MASEKVFVSFYGDVKINSGGLMIDLVIPGLREDGEVATLALDRRESRALRKAMKRAEQASV